MATSLASNNNKDKNMTIITSECCSPEANQAFKKDNVSIPSCQERYVTQRMNSFPPTASIIRRKSSLSICCKASRTQRQRATPVGQRMFEHLLSHENRKERLLVPDLATEWFRKQKIFLDQVTPEEQLELKQQQQTGVKEPTLMSYVCECRQRCGCGNESSTLQHSVQYLDYCQELRRRRLLLQRQRRQRRQNEPICKCSDPPTSIRKTDKEQQLQQQQPENRCCGGMLRTKPATGTLYPHRTCSCLRNRSNNNSCACTFQADGQPMSEECRLAVRCRTQSSLMRLRKKCSLRETPQRQLHPACYRRISPEFYSLLKRYEDGMSERYPLYGLPKRYWGKSTPPCCPCEMSAVDPCADECLGDQSLATERVDTLCLCQYEEEEQPKKQLKPKESDPDVEDESEECSCECECDEESTETPIDSCQDDTCFLSLKSEQFGCETNTCENRLAVKEEKPSCSSEPCTSETCERSLTASYSTEKENIQSDVLCTDATCSKRHEESTVPDDTRSSRVHFTSGLDPSLKGVCLGNSVSQQGYYRKSRKQRHNTDEPPPSKRKGILNSMAGLCKRVMQPGRYLLYNLSTLQRQPTYEKPVKEEEPAAAAQPRWVLPSAGANTSSMFSQKPRRGSSKQRKPDQQWTTSQATASGYTTQSSRQLSRHYYSQYSGNRNSIQSEHVIDQPFVFTQPNPVTHDSNRVAAEPEQVPQGMEEVRSTVAASQLTANVVVNDSYNDTSSTVHSSSKLSLSGSQLTAETTETAETQLTESEVTSIDTLQPEIVDINVTKKEKEECRKEPAFRLRTGGPSYTPASDYAELMRIVARKRTRTKQRKRRVVSFADKERNTDKKSTNPMHLARERYKTLPARNRSTSPPTRKRRKANKVTQLNKSDLKDRQIASCSRPPMYNLLEPAVRGGRRQYSEESYANYNRNNRDFRDRRTRDRGSYECFDNRNSQGNYWERNRTRSYERSYNPRDQGYAREYSNQPYYRSSHNNGRNFMELSDTSSRSTVQYGSQASSDFRDFQTPYAMSVASYKGYDPQPSEMYQQHMSSNSSYQANTPPTTGQQSVERRPNYNVSEPELRDVPVMRRSHSMDSFPSSRRSTVPSQHTQHTQPSNHTISIAKAEQVSTAMSASTSKQPSQKSSVPRWQSKSKKSETSTSLLPKIFSSKPPINEKLIKLREAAAKVPKVKLKAQHRKAQCSLRTRRPPPPPRRVLMEQLRQQQQMLQSTMDFRQERVLAHQHYEQAQPIHNEHDDNDRNNDSREPSTTLSFGADKWRSRSGCDMHFRDNDEKPKQKAISENSSSIGIQCDRRSFVHTPAPSSMRKSRKRVKVYATPESSDCSRNGSLERKKSRSNKKQSKTNLSWQKTDRFKQSEDEDEDGRHEFPTNERYERNHPQVIKQGMSRAIVSTGKLLSLPDYGEAGRGIIAKRSKDFDNSYEDDPLFSESFAYPPDNKRRSSSVSDKYAIEPPEIKGKQQRQLLPKPSSILKAVAKPLTNVLKHSSDFRHVNFVPRQNNSDSSLEACIDPNKFSCSRYENYSTVGTPSCYTVQAGTRRPAILRAHTVHNTMSCRDDKPQTAVNKSRRKLPSLFAVPTTATYTETFNRVAYDLPNADTDRLSVRQKTQEEHEREQRHLPMNCQLFSKRSDFPNTRIIQNNNDRYMPPSVSLVSDLDFNTHCEHSRNVTAEEMRKAGGGTMQAIDVSLMLATAISRRHHKATTPATTSSTGREPTRTMQTYQKVSGGQGSTRTDRTFPCYADETAGNNDNYCQKRHCCLRRLPEEPVVIEPTHTGLRVQQVRQTCLPVLFYGRKC